MREIRFKIKRTNLLQMAILAMEGNKKALTTFVEFTKSHPNKMILSYMSAIVTSSLKEKVIGEPLTDIELSYLERFARAS